MLKPAGSWVMDALFPHCCGICGVVGTPLCDNCFRSLPRRSRQTCGHCGIRETPLGSTCHDCFPTSEDGIFSASNYDSPKISRLIHLFKYRFIHDLSRALGTLIAEAVTTSELPLPDALIPVPLHPRRERWRGWNQSALIARELISALPQDIAPPLVESWLMRTVYTAPQMPLSVRSDRERNVQGAFTLASTHPNGKLLPNLQGKRVWIIDDVAASGSTLRECARTLKTAGVREVWGIVIAR